MKKLAKFLFRSLVKMFKMILSVCLVLVLMLVAVLGIIYIEQGREKTFQFVSSDLPKQFSFLENLFIDKNTVFTTQELQQYFSASLEEGENHGGIRVKFSGIYTEYDTVSLIVYPDYVEGDKDGGGWKAVALGMHEFQVELKEGVTILPGYIEGEGVILRSSGTGVDMKFMSVRVTKAENKEFNEIVWDASQVVGEQDFEIQQTKKINIPLYNGGVLSCIDFTNRGAYLVIEYKQGVAEKFDTMVIQQGKRKFATDDYIIRNQSEIRWIPELNANENLIISFESDLDGNEVFRADVLIE